MDLNDTFKFVKKIFPRMDTSKFSMVVDSNGQNRMILIPSDRLFEAIRKGYDPMGYNEHLERSFYSVELRKDGYFDIVKVKKDFYVMAFRKGFNVIDFTPNRITWYVDRVECIEFCNNFHAITDDLKIISEDLLLNGIDYCKESSRLMDSI